MGYSDTRRRWQSLRFSAWQRGKQRRGLAQKPPPQTFWASQGFASPYTDSTTYPSLPENTKPTSIAAGPGGTTIWFTEAGPDEIGEIASGGTLSQFPLPSGLTGTLGNIVLGPDGNLWVGLSGASSYVLRVTPAGVITPFALPAGAGVNVDVLLTGDYPGDGPGRA